ncbi:hypothetical protein DBT_1942 [Dissulfuribacter thermophilus]|uniref:Uncharacterized protein n=1 Tax=Dissulfuribacter thermophilus TaxID=1156395 RepID=A0A1B9F3W5_9BACT|nr:hypothetical protein DBT_1942 [Dissulfuribacter thermophilus]
MNCAMINKKRFFPIILPPFLESGEIKMHIKRRGRPELAS